MKRLRPDPLCEILIAVITDVSVKDFVEHSKELTEQVLGLAFAELFYDAHTQSGGARRD